MKLRALLFICTFLTLQGAARAEETFVPLRTVVAAKTQVHYSLKGKGFVTADDRVTLTFSGSGKTVSAAF